MISREYSTEYDDFTECIKHSINIITDNPYVFHTIKVYAESVCESEDYQTLKTKARKGENHEIE